MSVYEMIAIQVKSLLIATSKNKIDSVDVNGIGQGEDATSKNG